MDAASPRPAPTRRPTAHGTSEGARMSAEVFSGYMAALAIFMAAIAVVHKPLVLSVAALLLALVATVVGGGRRLNAFAVGAATTGFVLGMAVAVLTGNNLY